MLECPAVSIRGWCLVIFPKMRQVSLAGEYRRGEFSTATKEVVSFSRDRFRVDYHFVPPTVSFLESVAKCRA